MDVDVDARISSRSDSSEITDAFDDARSVSPVHSEYTRSSSVEYEQRKNRLDTKGVILRTSVVSTGGDAKPVLNRTLLLDSSLYEHPINPYVPPVFLMIMYERTPYMRYDPYVNERPVRVECAQNTEAGSDGARQKPKITNTEHALRENKLLIGEMLKLADCSPDSTRHCFLRLEHAGSLQSTFADTFPTPALKIGCLARLSFSSLRKRNAALHLLSDNGASNSDLYAINYSSNSCASTVTRYLEPLFRHALELQKAWSVDDVRRRETETTDDDGVFDVNFHLLDVETERRHANDRGEDRPIFFVGSTDRDSSRQMRTAIKERTGRISPLTVHDVSQFYRHPTFYGDRNGAAQLQSLPVVYVRHERDFICLSACTEYKGQHVLLHVYYVWSGALADNLVDLSTAVNRSNENETSVVRMSVCDVFEDRIAAYVKMLDDARTCFWKKHTNTYVRLVLNSVQDDTVYSRFVLHSLMTHGISSGKVSLQSQIEGCRKTADGGLNVFPNSITLDCSKLAEDLDNGVSAFADAYERNTRGAAAHASSDGASDLHGSALVSRQTNVGDMLLRFKVERIAELSYDAAREMYLGVLDLYGVARNNDVMRYDPVANYMFVRTLVNESVYTNSTTFDTDLHALVKRKNAEDDKLVPAPCASFQEGVHYAQEDKEIHEFDIESAYPTIVETFNVSPETTVIMRKTEFDKIERRLEGLLESKEEGRYKLSRWCFVVPYADAPEDLVIVSLVPYVYRGCIGGAFKSLVLKRRTGKKISAHFYKRLANRLCGGMGQKGSDLYAVHCLAAAVSLCRTAVTRTLNNLKHTVKVLHTQTDGGLVQATRKSEWLAAEIQIAFSDSIDSMLSTEKADVGMARSLMQLKVRNVEMCFVAGQNKYAVRYADHEKVLKGHPAKFVPSAAAEAAVTEAVVEAVDNISQAGYECKCEDVLNTLMDSVCERMTRDRLSSSTDDEDDVYYMERMIPFENRREEEKILDSTEFKYDQHCRFGDTVPLWPVVQIEGDRMTRAYVCRPNGLWPSLVVDRFAVLRQLINAWALELCRSQCCDFRTDRQSEGNYIGLFYSKLLRAGNRYAEAIHNSRQD